MNQVLLTAFLLYAVFLGFFVIWSVFLAYHLLRFGPYREVARMFLAVYLSITFLLLVATVVALSRVDWPSLSAGQSELRSAAWRGGGFGS